VGVINQALVATVCALCVLLAIASSASAAGGIGAQRDHARRVEARVNAMGVQLESVVQAWDGERAGLEHVNVELRTAQAQLRIAHGNLTTARGQLERRLRQLYMSPQPTPVEIFVGAKGLSDLIDRLEAAHALTNRDRAIAAAATRFATQITERERTLRRDRRRRVALSARLASERAQIADSITTQKRLLASIHETIATLQARQAARVRRRAALAQQRIAREVARARKQAAAEAVQPRPTALSPAPPAAQPPAAPPPPVTTTPIPAPAPAPAPPPPAPAAPSPPPPAPVAHADAASIAAHYLGVRYVWGGATPSGFDCSGLVMYVYAQLGVSLPHYTVAQWGATEAIPASALQPGDLVFFDGLSHVGIYIGGGQFIHAPHTGTVVQISSLSGYWLAHLDGARRVR
jgi:cell wall-associated NlpC family hydrolase